MMTNLVHCDFDALAIGQNVRLVFELSESGMPVACFQPVSIGEVHVSN
jgi:hypothetical protein